MTILPFFLSRYSQGTPPFGFGTAMLLLLGLMWLIGSILFGIIEGSFDARHCEPRPMFDVPFKKICFLYGPSYVLGYWLNGGYQKAPKK